MLEKDIENLIARNPEEFFPNSGFKLLGQQIKLGKCYADIIFEDQHKRKVIIEVKRGILSRDASGQVMEYYGLLKLQHPNDNIELILCANIIPPERKLFLERAGIECKELGINLINKIADKLTYKFISTFKDHKKLNIELPTVGKVWIFQGTPQRYDIMNALAHEKLSNETHWLVNQHRREILKGDIGMIWMSGKEAGIYAITEIITDPKMMAEGEAEKEHWLDSEDAEGERVRVKMKIIKSMLACPLMKETLRSNGLGDISILKQPRGTNFPITPEQWIKIRNLIQL